MTRLLIGATLLTGGILVVGFAETFWSLDATGLWHILVVCLALTPAVLYAEYIREGSFSIFTTLVVWITLLLRWVVGQVADVVGIDGMAPIVNKHDWLHRIARIAITAGCFCIAIFAAHVMLRWRKKRGHD